MPCLAQPLLGFKALSLPSLSESQWIPSVQCSPCYNAAHYNTTRSSAVSKCHNANSEIAQLMKIWSHMLKLAAKCKHRYWANLTKSDTVIQIFTTIDDFVLKYDVWKWFSPWQEVPVMKVPMALRHCIPWFTYNAIAVYAPWPPHYKRGSTVLQVESMNCTCK